MTARSLALRLTTIAFLVLSALPLSAQNVRPSENAHKTGTFKLPTFDPDYNYYLYVPETYNETTPHGIALYFHGQGCGTDRHNQDFNRFRPLEAHNVIMINMMYSKFESRLGVGDMTRDVPNKVRAARQALDQTLADYHIVPGRGVIASFSGGGVVHEAFQRQFGAQQFGFGWPFGVGISLSSNYRGNPTANTPLMGWVVGAGTGGRDWTLANAGVGRDACKNFRLLFTRAAGAGLPEVYLNIQDRPHRADRGDVAIAAEILKRFSLFVVPFVSPNVYSDRAVKTAAGAANTRDFKKALDLAQGIVDNERATPEARAEAEHLLAAIRAQLDAATAELQSLAQNDPMLAAAYGEVFSKQVRGLPEADTVRGLPETMGTSLRDAQTAYRTFASRLNDTLAELDRNSGVASAGLAGFLRSVAEKTPPESMLHRMVSQWASLAN